MPEITSDRPSVGSQDRKRRQMEKPAPRRRRARGSIDPEKILDGAFEIAEREGIDGLSMPGLAAHLDVGVTSIYWYFRNKEELLRKMSARAMTAIQARTHPQIDRSPDEWRAVLGEGVRKQREVYLESNLNIEMTIMRTATYSRRATHLVYDNVEAELRYLISAGFTLASAWQVFSACSIYVRGIILAEYNRRINKTPPEGLAQLSLLDPETMPLVARLITDEGAMIDNAGEKEFEFGLEMLLDAAERVLENDRATVEQPAS